MFIRLKTEHEVYVWFNLDNIISVVEMSGGTMCRIRLKNGEDLYILEDASSVIKKAKGFDLCE